MLRWYVSVFVLIWFMVMLGGATRLTHAGLSIVEWKPIAGFIPPLSLSDWMIEFQKYQLTPEFIKINNGMSLADFKFIYWMEFLHRFLGRIIAFVYFIPLFFYWRHLTLKAKKINGLLLLVGLFQGFMGWYMVKSGLVDHPSVSPYRLTIHLSLAFVLMGLLVVLMRDHLENLSHVPHHKAPLLYSTAFFIIVTILYGGLVAGFKAGLIYNTFPLMNGQLVPDEFFAHSPAWINFFNNHATIQWMHRTLGLLALFHTYLCYKKIPCFHTKILFLLVFLQVCLGILTLLFFVPVALGTLHQGIGSLVFSWIIFTLLSMSRKGQHS